MKRFQFPEQTLLRLRRQEKHAAEAAVMRASHAVTDLEREIDALQHRLLESLQTLTAKSKSHRDQPIDNAATWRSMRSIQNGQSQLSHNIKLLAAAQHMLEQSRNDLHRAEISLKTIEKLRESRFAAHHRLWQAKQQQSMDESTLRMWMNERREAVSDD